MPKKRQNHTAEEKVSILRRHFLEKAAISSLCEEYGIHLTTFYLWQKQFFENGAAAFTSSPSREDSADKQRIAALEARLARKHEVLSELMEEHLRTKKALGVP